MAQVKIVLFLVFFTVNLFATVEYPGIDDINSYLYKRPPKEIVIYSSLESDTIVTFRFHVRININSGGKFEYNLPSLAKKNFCEGDHSTADDTIIITNNDSKIVTYNVSFDQQYSIAPKIENVYTALSPFRFRGISSTTIINLVRSEPIKIELSTQRKPILPLLLSPFNLADCSEKALTPPEYICFFRDNIVPGFAGSRYFTKMQDAYNAFLKKLPELKPSNPLKIPMNVHTIWLTNPEAPKLPKPETFDLLVESMNNLPSSKGWKYILWVHNLSDLPALFESPSQGRGEIYDEQIQVRAIAEFFSSSKEYEYYLRALQEPNYGKASDIARLMILQSQGGIYRDTDFAFLADVKELLQTCDFFAGLERRDAIVACNAVIAARPNHPVINGTLSLIAERFEAPALHMEDRIIETLFQTGPFALSQSFYERAAEEENVDVLMPPHIFYYPSVTPDKHGTIHKRQIWPAASLGYHLHYQEWV